MEAHFPSTGGGYCSLAYSALGLLQDGDAGGFTGNPGQARKSHRDVPVKRNSYNEFARWLRAYSSGVSEVRIGQ